MADAFVQGGGGEVHISAVIALNVQKKAFWTRGEKEAAAEAYEQKNPGTLVIRDWWGEGEIDAARKGRKVVARKNATQGGDPERLAGELRRVYAIINGIEPTHPQYERLWANYTQQAHELEDACGIRRTTFTKGRQPKKADDPISAALQERLNEYARLEFKQRKAFITTFAANEKTRTEDAAFLRLVLDNEPDPTLQAIAVEKMTVLGAF